MDRNLLILIGAAGALLAVVSAWLLSRKGPEPNERERRRLAALEQSGRIVSGHVDDVNGAIVTYEYEVAGVGYVASQDLSEFFLMDSGTLAKLSGHVSVRYDRANPSNSMVHAQRWSGLGLA